MKTPSTIDQVQKFLSGTREISFSLESKEHRYQFIRRTLIRFKYYNLTKPDKSILLGYLTHMTGYSPIRVTRLVLRWLKKGKLEGQPPSQNGFRKRYTGSDKRLPAKLDELHDTLSGPATKKLCERASRVFDHPEYKRLATIHDLRVASIQPTAILRLPEPATPV